MSQQFNNPPDYGNPLVVNEYTSKSWYLFWLGLYNGMAPGAVVPVPATASPFTYTAVEGKGFMILTGGTVSLVEFSRDGTTFYNYGTTVGQFHLSFYDRLRVTYTVAPTLTFVPT